MNTDANLSLIANLKDLVRDIIKEEFAFYFNQTKIEKMQFNTKEAAEYLGISINTLYKLNRTNEITMYVQGKQKMYLKEDLDRYKFDPAKKQLSKYEFDTDMRTEIFLKNRKKCV